MPNKSNIRSIRFTDEVYEAINQQAGNTFTEKFERLVYRCMWELPAKEAELARVQQATDEERKRLDELRAQVGKLKSTASNLQWSAEALQKAIDRALKNWT